MTSPSIRRQREYDRQGSIPQPNFGGPVNARHMIPMVAKPSAPIQGRINWQEKLNQDFQARHNQWLWHHGGRDQIDTQRQINHDQEAFQHQAHMADLQW